ncbi:BtrH N-terminal domain-containing protein [Paenibacillus sp. N3/727]|uniref:BtrH N-terminal domain-containing protein n=1 Tax=Paenibacillus sp. N3/727 TaxID=2925845 RepID=UPI001F538153|nr:BtrH N-terminal domain-containing protein [Paenibacillus sp. N3/727]UNK15971.1 BtrH N-terminal domain-containing protein [Paenibacillus sp. N3/727]
MNIVEMESVLTDKTMRSVKLPFEMPQVYGFLGHAYVLGILQPFEYAQPWIHTSYIQLFIAKHYLNDLQEYRLDFYPDLMIAYNNMPWLMYKHSDKVLLDQLGVDIHRYLITQLEREYYVVTYVDEFYIHNSICYQQNHFVHDIFIYGYDLDRQIYHVAIFDKNRQFTMQEVTFEQFGQAYASQDKTTHSLISSCKRMEPLDYEGSKYGSGVGRFDFDLQLMIDVLTDYLEGRNSTERLRIQQQPMEGYFGVEIYPYLQEFVTRVIEGVQNFDVRQLHILWEHKKMMVARIKYLQQLGYLQEETSLLSEAERLEKQAYTHRNLMLKGFMSNNRNILQPLVHSLEEMLIAEKALITQLIEELRK